MAVISRQEIERRLRLGVAEDESLVITPLLRPDLSFDADSVDLRLGSHFLMPQIPPQPFFDPTKPESHELSHLHVHVPLGSFLVVPAHQTVLGVTLEFIKLPYDLSGEILTKSSVARTFMVIETAPWIHPLYRGCLTLEIANVSNTPLLIYPGTSIAQLVLLENSAGAEVEDRISGSYLGPVYPEVTAFQHPKDQLRAIGIDRYRDPQGNWTSTLR